MEIRIAVASVDGKNIDSHFGRVEQFLVFLVMENGYRYLETRENVPACSGVSHDDNRLDDSAALIADCQGVIASQIGPGAVDVLLGRRILPFAMSGTIDEGLRVLMGSPRLSCLKKRCSGGSAT